MDLLKRFKERFLILISYAIIEYIAYELSYCIDGS